MIPLDVVFVSEDGERHDALVLHCDANQRHLPAALVVVVDKEPSVIRLVPHRGERPAYYWYWPNELGFED